MTVESESDVPRSTSATSSLDPYYFTIPSRDHSPAPPRANATPSALVNESLLSTEPSTPAKDPASIDRKGLVGVGELFTPRWTRSENNLPEFVEGQPPLPIDKVTDQELVEADGKAGSDDDGRGSPWTIEAIDGELEGLESEEVRAHVISL